MNVAVLIATTDAGLDALAAQYGAQILPGTRVRFSGLETFPEDAMVEAGQLSTDKPGWVALAKV